MPSPLHRLLSVLLITLCLPASRAAAEPSDPPVSDKVSSARQPAAGKEPQRPIYTLEEIVVTATRTEDSTQDVAIGMSVVDRKELEERMARTPAEALRYKPGIWVQKTGHLGGAPVLRGFMGNRVIYLFDGIRRNTAGLFKGPNSFLQSIDALDMDRIEVVRGPGSVLYGSDAIGGVVNVLTNEDPVYSDELGFGGRFYSRYASADQETSSRLEGYATSPDVYAFAGITRRDIDDLRGGRGVGVQDPSGWQETDWDAQVDYRLADDHEVEFFVQDFSRPVGRRFDRPNWRQTNDRELYGLRYRGKKVGFIDDLTVTAYFHDQRGFIDEKFWDSKTDDDTVGLEVQAVSYPTDSLRLVYGFDYHRDDITKSNPQGRTEDPDVTWENPAVFLLSEWQATSRFKLDAGVRWDLLTLRSSPPSLDKLPGSVTEAIQSGSFSRDALNLDETQQAVTGGLGAVYALTDRLNLVSHLGTAFRAPNKSDMLSFGQFTFGFNVPSPDLDPERSWTWEIGLHALDEDYSAALTYFYTRINDAIVSRPGTFGGSDFVDVDGDGKKDDGSDPDGGGPEQVYVNTNSDGAVVAQGVEAEAIRYLPQPWNEALLGDTAGAFSVYGNFSWIIGKDRGFDEPLDRAFPANGLIGFKWENDRDPDERKAWLAIESWMVRRFDRIPSTRVSTDPAFRTDPQDMGSPLLREDGAVPGFTLFNLRAGLELRENVTLTAAVENLTDRRYRMKDSRIDGAGMNFMVGLDVRF